VLGWSCRVDGLTLSNQILLWLPESSNLCVVLHCHDEATLYINGMNFKGILLKISCSLPCYWLRKENIWHYFLGNPRIYTSLKLDKQKNANLNSDMELRNICICAGNMAGTFPYGWNMFNIVWNLKEYVKYYSCFAVLILCSAMKTFVFFKVNKH
jgi:hypothetical protein